MSNIPSESGLYFVRLVGEEMAPVIKHRQNCIWVNSANSKYGLSLNLRRRFSDYCGTFGKDRVRFDVVLLNETPRVLEQKLNLHFQKYRMRSPSGQLNEWLEGIDPEDAFQEVREICSERSVSGVVATRPARTPTSTNSMTMHQRGQVFTPDDILEAARYLKKHGMTEQALSEIHHFERQRYQETYDYFSRKSSIRSETNSLYAARLDYIMRGHMSGGNFADLVPQALGAFPHSDA